MKSAGTVTDIQMKTLIVILISFTILSCETKSTSNENQGNNFQALVSNLKTLEVGYTYDLGKQDAEGCYGPENSDTLFYSPPFPILGQFKNGAIYSLIHFEPGDDMWPIIRTFDKDGKSIDNATIVFGNCAGLDCDYDECEEKFKIVNASTIESVMTVVTTPCDSVENKDPKLTKKEIWKRTLTIDEKGIIHSMEEQN
jgi:hypothetical protein